MDDHICLCLPCAASLLLHAAVHKHRANYDRAAVLGETKSLFSVSVGLI